MRVSDLPEIAKLSTEERILLLEDLWDSIAVEEGKVPVPQSHIEELDARYRKYLSNPRETLTLEELRGRIEGAK